MWWNYRKPKPLQDGAYRFATKHNVPIIPRNIANLEKNSKDVFDFKRYPSSMYG